MPIFKAGPKLVFYAHVPKCGGSSVSWYLRQRFGQLAFNKSTYLQQDPKTLWSRTSPQHIDRNSMGMLFPDGFFDACFTIVRHPVDRLVSAFHYQQETENRISSNVSFSDWLDDLEDLMAENPFVFDNHTRPMTEIVPDGAKVFYVEHGIDAMIPWLDELVGEKTAPRAIPRRNERSANKSGQSARVIPSADDLVRIENLYSGDFERFGYRLEERKPIGPEPIIPQDLVEERDAALREMNRPGQRLIRKLKKSFNS